MKIVVLGTRGFPNVQGGVEKHCEQLYPYLARKGCEVTVLARRPYLKEGALDYKGVKIISLLCPRNKFFEAFLHTLYGVYVARRMRPDILHIHAVGPSLFIPLARLLGLKVVMTNHGPDYKRAKWGYFAKLIIKLGERFGTRSANGIIAVSGSIADRIRKEYKRELNIIPNGIDIPEALEVGGTLKRYALTKSKYILAVGRFVPEKGFSDLIDAFNMAELNGWKLVIAGTADHESKYSRGLKEKAGKNGNIVLTGFLIGRPLQELYSHAGLFALPSYYEGLPIALLEAMSYGLRCVASDIPANRDVGLSNENYFAVGDIKGLVRKLRTLVNRPLSVEQRTRQIAMLRQKYNWEDIAQKTLDVYKRVTGSSAGI